MNLHSLKFADLPIEGDERRLWLEEMIVSSALGAFVAELEIWLSPSVPVSKLAILLGEDLESVLENGLSPLSDEKLSLLLKNPRSLFELQEEIFIQGGGYWREKTDMVSMRESVGGHVTDNSSFLATIIEKSLAQTKEVTASEFPQRPPTANDSTIVNEARPQVQKRHSEQNSRKWIGVLASLAALVLVVFSVRWLLQEPDGWGFNRPGVFAANVNGSDYLRRLADAAEEFNAKQSNDIPGLIQRIQQFEKGCDRLIAEKHTPLADADKDWLVERCQLWKSKLTEQRMALASGTQTVEETQTAVQQIVSNLQKALRDRASSIG
ncbi:hypothetical protein SH449x_003287 [Pirellulaceae bacterium SH449]